jgi:Saxitoxin biosynthesis operon protein SxtJ
MPVQQVDTPVARTDNQQEAMTRRGPANPERSFGLSVGAVLCAIGIFLAWRGRTFGAEVIGSIGAVLLVCGLLYPPVLKGPSALWWRFAQALGYVNARVLLTVLFTIALLPLSLIWRAIGKDPLARRRSQYPGWTTYPGRYRDHNRARSHRSSTRCSSVPNRNLLTIEGGDPPGWQGAKSENIGNIGNI